MAIVQIRSRIQRGTFWIEFGLGVRYPVVEDIFAELMEIPPSEESTTLGCDLAHLVKGPNHSGWEYALAGFDKEQADELLEIFKSVAVPEFDRFRSIDDLYDLARRRMKRASKDVLTMNEAYVIPIVLMLHGDREECREYVAATVAELHRLGESNPFFQAYTKFSENLSARLTRSSSLSGPSKH